MIRITDLYGKTKVDTPGSSTPTTDLEPSLPAAVPNHYTPDDEYSRLSEATRIGVRRKRWFLPIDIGVVTKTQSNAISIASPLTIAAGKQTIEFQDPPEKCIVGTLASNGNAAELDIWIGDGGGFPIRIGNGGKVVIPLQGESRISIQAFGQSIKGTIIAVAGFDDNELDFIPASQP